MEKSGCKIKVMEREIYYFSGTGNSLFMTKELQNLLSGAKLIPIAKCIKDNDYSIKGKTAGKTFKICSGKT